MATRGYHDPIDLILNKKQNTELQISDLVYRVIRRKHLYEVQYVHM